MKTLCTPNQMSKNIEYFIMNIKKKRTLLFVTDSTTISRERPKSKRDNARITEPFKIIDVTGQTDASEIILASNQNLVK
jgi:hypothetical protein